MGNLIQVEGLIDFDFDMDNAMKKLEKRLGPFSQKAPSVMKYALNKAAMSARRENAKVAKKRYDFQAVHAGQTLNANKLMKIERASAARLEARLITRSNMGSHYHFSVSPRALAWTDDKPAKYRGRILKKQSRYTFDAERLEDNAKPADPGSQAFITAWSSGYAAVVYRMRNQKAKNRKGPLNKHTQAIWKVSSPGLMSMSARSFEEKPVQASISDTMDKALTQKVAQVLKGG